MDSMLTLLKELTEAPGPSGHEEPVRKIIEKNLPDCYSVNMDKLGSIIANKQGDAKGPKVMMSAHMDELGFLVNRITDQGFLRFTQIGGMWVQRLIGMEVTVLTKNGPIPGVIECKSEHRMAPEERDKIVPDSDLFIDIGAGDPRTVKQWGIRPGVQAIPATQFKVMAQETMLMGKAWDNRASCGLMVEVLKQLVGLPHPNTIYGAGTVQEEVGIRGAQTAGNLIKPNVGLILDISVATDMPGLEGDKVTPVVLGEGPVLTVYDSSMMPNEKLIDLIIDTADQEEIPLQFAVVARGGTDGGRIHLLEDGVPCAVLGVPTRYIHAAVGIINKTDYKQTIQLVLACIKRLDRASVDKLTA